MRLVLIATVIIAAMSFDAQPVLAKEGPWCAFIAVAEGAIYEDCQYWSFEACRPVILAGNRGFCNPNPRWVEPMPQPGVRHKQRVQPN
jgi:hypothetical protein